ncbi:MAG: ROK family protein [Paracoccaceae bacterium]
MIVAFDIGASRIKAGVARNGMVEPLGEAATPLDDFAEFAGAMARFLRGRAAQAVAVSIAGIVDPATGRAKVANIPCINGRPLADDLRAALKVPVLVLNDADCFALAEARWGAGRGHRNVFGVILGSGVGGGLVLDGRLVAGAGGYAGEWGHGPVLKTIAAGHPVPHFACGCGQSGCVDTVGGARGIERLHLHLNGRALSSHDILAAWAAGDKAAARTVDVWLDLLAPPLSMVVNTVGCSVVPVGGGLSTAPGLVAVLDRVVRGMILRASDVPLLVPAGAGDEPGLIGAAAAGEEAFG